jgi:phosphatidyl-myo-inositol dimannoside synthase
MASSSAFRYRRALVLVSEIYADGGIQRFNRTLVTALSRLGIKCQVLSLGDAAHPVTLWSPPALIAIETFERDKPRFALQALTAIVRGGLDFVIVGHINLLELVVAARHLQRSAQTLLIAHGIDVWTGIVGRRRRALARVDRILCVSAYTRDEIRRQAPEVPLERFSVFHNALSESWSEQLGGMGRARLAGVPERYILSVTRFDRGDRYKGIVSVLEGLSMLEDSSLNYVLAGRGNDAPFLQRVAAQFGVADRVHFLGGVSDVELAALYRHCLAFVLPSGKEGFGIVFLEAMFFGACVIAAREKGTLDVVRDGENGLLVPFGDVVALRRAVDRVIADEVLRERLCAGGLACVAGDGPFTFRSYLERLAAVLGVPAPGAARENLPGGELGRVVAIAAAQRQEHA